MSWTASQVIKESWLFWPLLKVKFLMNVSGRKENNYKLGDDIENLYKAQAAK